DHVIDGKDIGPLFRCEAGAKSPQEAYYYFWGKDLHAVRSGNWKLYLPRTYITLDGKMGRDDGQPTQMKTVKAGIELFNLDEDESERTELADRHPEIVRRLRDLGDRFSLDLNADVARSTAKQKDSKK